MSVHEYPQTMLDGAKHTIDLRANNACNYVYVDSQMQGVGGVCDTHGSLARSQQWRTYANGNPRWLLLQDDTWNGFTVLEKYRIQPGHHVVSFRLSPLSIGVETSLVDLADRACTWAFA